MKYRGHHTHLSCFFQGTELRDSLGLGERSPQSDAVGMSVIPTPPAPFVANAKPLKRSKSWWIGGESWVTFASALRAFLRQDPDIVMVGEIRDHDTLEIAINASLTGHLVLSTIHTNDAAGAVTRTIDMGAEPFLLRSSVIGILAQRLVRVLCPNCKYTYPAEDFELEELGLTPERMRFRAARRNNPASRYFPRNVREGDG